MNTMLNTTQVKIQSLILAFNGKLALSKKECAKVLGVSESYINNNVSKKENIPRYIQTRAGANVHFRVEDIVDYLDSQVTIKTSY